jgi:hypothetical protein
MSEWIGIDMYGSDLRTVSECRLETQKGGKGGKEQKSVVDLSRVRLSSAKQALSSISNHVEVEAGSGDGLEYSIKRGGRWAVANRIRIKKRRDGRELIDRVQSLVKDTESAPKEEGLKKSRYLVAMRDLRV